MKWGANRIRLLLLSGIFLTTMTFFSGCGSKQEEPGSYGVFIGSTADMSFLSEYDTVVIDAQYYSKEQIDSFRKEGHKVYSYINIGSLENFRDYYDEYKDLSLGVYEHWEDEVWIDVSETRWQEFIVNALAPSLLEKDIDGFFVDNCDVYYNYKEERIFQGLCSIMKALRSTKKKVIINGGDNFLFDYYDKYGNCSDVVTGINQECVFTAVNWEDDSFIRAEDEDHEYFMEYIEKFGEMGTEVYLLEYTTDEALAAEIQDYCSEKGFSCYIADSLELTEREKTKEVSWRETQMDYVFEMPQAMLEETDKKGTVELLEYDSKTYDDENRDLHKAAWVYLPYGYDENEKYDILYLLHGGGFTQDWWLKLFPETATILDNMIAQGLSKPVIVVTPTFYHDENDKNTNDESRCENFRFELRNDLVPAVESKYAGYSKGDVSEKNLIATRDHRAFAGLSLGSMTTYRAAFYNNFDLFSYYGPFSGCCGPFGDHEKEVERICKTLADGKAQGYDLKFMLCCNGDKDIAFEEHKDIMGKAVAKSDLLVPGENYDFFIIPGGVHDQKAWELHLYHALQVFFKK